MIRCECVSELMRSNYGSRVDLTFSEARQLDAQGHVRIPEKHIPRKVLDNSHYLYRTQFGKRRLTRVAWVQNYSKDGGAEISNFTAVSVGADVGFDIVGINIDDMKNFDLVRQADVVIVNNLHSANHDEAVKRILALKIPFVVYSHDCIEKEFELFRRSALNVFISPRHKEHYVAAVGKEIDEKSICLPLAFDVDRFKMKVNGRKPKSVYVPTYRKGRDNVIGFIKANPDREYFVADPERPAGKNVFRVPSSAYMEMHNVYSDYETVLHLPERLCAGDRVLFEGVLCGCKVVTNENAGHSSWSSVFDWTDEPTLRKRLRAAPVELWRLVNDAIVRARGGKA